MERRDGSDVKHIHWRPYVVNDQTEWIFFFYFLLCYRYMPLWCYEQNMHILCIKHRHMYQTKTFDISDQT